MKCSCYSSCTVNSLKKSVPKFLFSVDLLPKTTKQMLPNCYNGTNKNTTHPTKNKLSYSSNNIDYPVFGHIGLLPFRWINTHNNRLYC